MFYFGLGGGLRSFLRFLEKTWITNYIALWHFYSLVSDSPDVLLLLHQRQRILIHVFSISCSGDFFQFINEQTSSVPKLHVWFPSPKSIYLKSTNSLPSQSCHISVTHLQNFQPLCSKHTVIVVSIRSHKGGDNCYSETNLWYLCFLLFQWQLKIQSSFKLLLGEFSIHSKIFYSTPTLLKTAKQGLLKYKH